MTGGEWAEIGYHLIGWTYAWWLFLSPGWLGRYIPGRAGEVIRTVWIECKPFALPAVGAWYGCRLYADWAAGHTGFNGRATWVLMIGLGTWWLNRNDGNDDDRWRRRRRKAAARIRALAGRLVVSPGGAS